MFRVNPTPLPRAALAGRPRAGVVRILVGAEVKDGVVVVKRGLRAVAVVHVEIGDHDPRVAEPLGVARRDGGVVDQAEAHAPGRLRVVPRRADGAERPGDRRPRGRNPARRRRPRRRRARLPRSATRRTCRDRGSARRGAPARPGRRGRGPPGASSRVAGATGMLVRRSSSPLALDVIEDASQPPRGLGVPGRGPVLEEHGVAEEPDPRHGGRASLPPRSIREAMNSPHGILTLAGRFGIAPFLEDDLALRQPQHGQQRRLAALPAEDRVLERAVLHVDQPLGGAGVDRDDPRALRRAQELDGVDEHALELLRRPPPLQRRRAPSPAGRPGR